MTLWQHLILDLYANSLMMFFTCALLIELFLLLPVSPRINYLCRLVPIFKLPIDLFRYQFANWAGLAPAYAAEGSRTISLSLPLPAASFYLEDSSTFSIVDLFSPHWPTYFVKGAASLLLLGSTIGLLLWAIRLIKEIYLAKQLCRGGTLVAPGVLVKEELETAVAISKHVIFPRKLFEKLDDEERRAVIQHERAHLRWCDGFVGTVVNLVRHIFWHIPLSIWIGRLKLQCELACDKAAKPIPLASALCKSAKSRLLFPTLSHKNSSTTIRLNHLIRKRRYSLASNIICILFCLFLALGRLWMF